MKMGHKDEYVIIPTWIMPFCYMALGAYVAHVISRIIELYF